MNFPSNIQIFKYQSANQNNIVHPPSTITLWWLYGLQLEYEIQGLDTDMAMLIQAESNSQIQNDISKYVAQLVIKLC